MAKQLYTKEEAIELINTNYPKYVDNWKDYFNIEKVVKGEVFYGLSCMLTIGISSSFGVTPRSLDGTRTRPNLSTYDLS